MDEAEFYVFSDEYHSLHASNIAISGERPEFFAEYKIKDIATEYLALHPYPEPLRMLDFGAGVGTSVPFNRQHFPHAHLTCMDVSAKSLNVDQSRFPGQAEFVRFDGIRIPMPDSSFNIVFAACVFHHIAHDEHVAILREFSRVLATGGMECVFEHNPFNPLTLHAVDTCPFDKERPFDSCQSDEAALRRSRVHGTHALPNIFFGYAGLLATAREVHDLATAWGTILYRRIEMKPILFP